MFRCVLFVDPLFVMCCLLLFVICCLLYVVRCALCVVRRSLSVVCNGGVLFGVKCLWLFVVC